MLKKETIYLHSIYFPNMEVNGYRQLSGYQHASKYYLAFNWRKKII